MTNETTSLPGLDTETRVASVALDAQQLALQCAAPEIYGQPSECCGSPETCRAACGDLAGSDLQTADSDAKATGEQSPDAPRYRMGAGMEQAIRTAFAALRERAAGFVPRRVQNVMIAQAANAAGNSGGVAAIEAKTGTGKSLAYLCACTPIALASQRRLVVATATIALQEQLVNRDIPIFLAATGLTASFAIGKSRQRYLCERNLRSLVGAERDPDGEGVWPRKPTARELEAAKQLQSDFDGGTWNGDLDQRAGLPEMVRHLSAPMHGSCIGQRCQFAPRCPGLQARSALEVADIVVLNHDLLLAELAAHREGSPNAVVDTSSDIFVIDEGHQLAAKAIDAGAESLPLASLAQLVLDVDRRIDWAFRMGIFERDAKRLKNWMDRIESVQHALQLLSDAVTRTTADAERAHDGLVWRGRLGEVSEHWRDLASRLHENLVTVAGHVRRARELSGKADGLSTGVRNKALAELGVFENRLDRYQTVLESWSAPPPEDAREVAPTARWVTRDEQGVLTLHTSSAIAGDLLWNLLWADSPSVVLTSATLSTGGDFRALREDLCLPEQAVTLALPSPFDLENQAELIVPRLRAPPSDLGAHAAEIAQWLESELDWSAGSLVLFTSKAKMRAVAEALPESMKGKVLIQGDQARARLLELHAARVRAGEGSVLMGTKQFGEGLDLPGELVTTVVVTQLPFAVPVEPVLATRSEWYEHRGLDPFDQIVIPEAIRMLEQFCGRLIRTTSDRGRIVILDNRLIGRRYGRRIIDAMPPFRRVIAQSTAVGRA